MYYPISCTRCGCSRTSLPQNTQSWEPVHCRDCGEFLGTVDQWEEWLTINYAVKMLNMSRALLLRMARERTACGRAST